MSEPPVAPRWSIFRSTWGTLKNAILGGSAAILFALFILLLSILTVTSPKAATEDPLAGPTATPSAQAVEYYLPYPGLLPDSPLYRLKAIRDRIQLSLTWDAAGKAQKELFFADKRINAAWALVEGGKTSLGASTATKAEKYLEQSARRTLALQKNGKDMKSLLLVLSKAMAKHNELVGQMMPKVSATDQLTLKKSLDTTRMAWDAVNQTLENR